jgi:predicted CXXCH cytochrome family protein
VSERGNLATAPAGYTANADSSYHDVQCESCHGPGFAHVSGPDLVDPPLAHLAVLEDTTASCASCHTGTHHPFVDEWKTTRHAAANSTVITNYASNPTTYGTCLSCHEGRSVLTAWGVTSNYVEKGDAISATTALGVQCAVCHDPHAADNEGQLRFPIDSPDPGTNLCMKCHSRRSEPQVASSQGPHAPQGAMLLGSAGYWPAGIVYDTALIVSSHGSERNPRLCAGCHVNSYTVTDAATGQLQVRSVGHLFRPIPCLDAAGKPTIDNSCAYTTAARTFNSCTTSGCHGSESAAQSALSVARLRIRQLADVIWRDLDGDKSLDAAPTDDGYLAIVRRDTPAELSTTDNKITAAEGALFNARLVGEGLYGNGDKSLSVHNPFLAEALLRANIDEMKRVYGFPSPPAAELRSILEGPLMGKAGRPPFRPVTEQ